MRRILNPDWGWAAVLPEPGAKIARLKATLSVNTVLSIDWHSIGTAEPASWRKGLGHGVLVPGGLPLGE